MSKSSNMYYLIYKITNIRNGKFYIGSHVTKDKEDGYMGSGVLIRKAIAEEGLENFRKEIIAECKCLKHMYAKERKLVVISDQSYNVSYGGVAGFFERLNSEEEYKELRVNKNKKAWKVTREKYKDDKWKEWAALGGRATFKKHGVPKKFLERSKDSFLGKKHTEETKKIIGEKNSKHQMGKGNSQFGTCWINDGVTNKKIPKTNPLPEGYTYGRVNVHRKD